MLSSAGAARVGRGHEGRAAGAADIPIVRLSPFGIPGRRRPRTLRASGWRTAWCARAASTTSGRRAGRSSRGDVAVGRTCRADVADVLVAALGEPAAARKTFEMLTPAGTAAALPRARARAAHDGGRAAPRASRPSTRCCSSSAGRGADATQLEMGRTQAGRPRQVARESGAAPTTREADLATTVSG